MDERYPYPSVGIRFLTLVWTFLPVLACAARASEMAILFSYIHTASSRALLAPIFDARRLQEVSSRFDFARKCLLNAKRYPMTSSPILERRTLMFKLCIRSCYSLSIIHLSNANKIAIFFWFKSKSSYPWTYNNCVSRLTFDKFYISRNFYFYFVSRMKMK